MTTKTLALPPDRGRLLDHGMMSEASEVTTKGEPHEQSQREWFDLTDRNLKLVKLKMLDVSDHIGDVKRRFAERRAHELSLS